MITTTSPVNLSNGVEISDTSSDLHDTRHVAYITAMFFILTAGFLGNLLTILVLYQPSLRKETLTPLMCNLAFADLFLTIFGYPTSVTMLLAGRDIGRDEAGCNWYGFANGTVGIASIVTFTEMTIVLSYTMHQMKPKYRCPRKVTCGLIVASWSYGVICMLPPFLGLAQYSPGAAGVNCGPDWIDISPSGMAYSLLLIAAGFFAPLLIISVFYFKIFKLLRKDIVPGNRPIRVRRRKWQIKLLRLTAVAITVFILSWSPYCLVSIVSIFRGDHLLSPGEAEIPDIMAKASVVYNPFLYTVMNRRFRLTLSAVVSRKRHRQRLPGKSKESSTTAHDRNTDSKSSKVVQNVY
ncbi:melanopsin-like [Stylophora pistillata]|uniref:melanopsin-like n=1 Tax=Stylophora pistillata TaxID=50429 RepID=UPI000C044511|nr:melanopsin-like [Stylophora pistillata]